MKRQSHRKLWRKRKWLHLRLDFVSNVVLWAAFCECLRVSSRRAAFCARARSRERSQEVESRQTTRFFARRLTGETCLADLRFRSHMPLCNVRWRGEVLTASTKRVWAAARGRGAAFSPLTLSNGRGPNLYWSNLAPGGMGVLGFVFAIGGLVDTHLTS